MVESKRRKKKWGEEEKALNRVSAVATRVKKADYQAAGWPSRPSPGYGGPVPAVGLAFPGCSRPVVFGECRPFLPKHPIRKP
ncbi:hypothetical protein QYE76_038013 [Lolium multiflorum]|uniref:Uncharacterized protein n=1 Tax=Lolium multiflorum TaxID=4521 RepID=A0AAD8T6N9_LOLMU|nr:hypothetical protein QYE76_038013 [Lolium multiflorum]